MREVERCYVFGSKNSVAAQWRATCRLPCVATLQNVTSASESNDAGESSCAVKQKTMGQLAHFVPFELPRAMRRKTKMPEHVLPSGKDEGCRIRAVQIPPADIPRGKAAGHEGRSHASLSPVVIVDVGHPEKASADR